MPATEEQRRRAEANRLAALAKRKALTDSQTDQHQQNPWRLFKCRKLSSPDTILNSVTADPGPGTHLAENFRVVLEICSPDSFLVRPEAVTGLLYPGEDECLKTLSQCLSNTDHFPFFLPFYPFHQLMASRYTQNIGGEGACVYKLRDYDEVLTCLKNLKGVEIEKIPFGTLHIIQKLGRYIDTGKWEPHRPEHLTDEAVDEAIAKLPKKLLDVLLPFQVDGLRFGLRRGGRCLIADEMGLGKTLQAIAIAGCFIHEGPILIVCPAVLRYSWAEELERWLPSCLPSEIHLVFGHQNNPANLEKNPRVVVISFKMLHVLKRTMLGREWALMIIDESHHLRCSKTKESLEIEAALAMAAKIKRIVLLSGTPSLSRPGLLGQNKYDFAKTYCAVKIFHTAEGKGFQDFSKGVRLEELNVLLKQTVMIRRLKQHLLAQLPPKRRQIIRLLLKKSDILQAKTALAVEKSETEGASRKCSDSNELSLQELGVAKLPGFREWLSIHPLISEADGVTQLDVNPSSQKMIIFAHHLKVLDGVQEFLFEKKVGFVRIDGSTLARDRQLAVLSFKSSDEVKVAIIGIKAGGVGLDFSAAQNVVFLELPQCPSLMAQAEDRAHRRGQTKAVNIYIFCAKDTEDERIWQRLNRNLRSVSSATNGKYDALPEITVDGVSYVETPSMVNESFGGQGSEKALCGQLSETELTVSPGSGSAVDTHTVEAQGEALGGLPDRCVEHYDFLGSMIPDYDFHCENSSVLDQEMGEDSVPCENIETKETECYSHRPVPADGTSLQQNGSSSGDPYLIRSLRFEVSKYTGRIHLYSCIPGKDSRPQPLFESFRPEELEPLESPTPRDREASSTSSSGSPDYRQAVRVFIDEWNKLRPIEKRKLVEKTLQLPLAVELCYLNETLNHNQMGLLKGQSKRRKTPVLEISHPLPPDASWKIVHLSRGPAKKERTYTQGWLLSNEPLCKLCQSPCKGVNARTPEYFEDLFCNLSCYEEYQIRTSNRSLRQELFQIEHGVCTNCKLDCHHLVKTIKALSLDKRKEYVKKVAPKVAGRIKLLEKLVNYPAEGNAWHADHIVPVYNGGGECRLENMRTLCVACHYDVTTAQGADRRLARAKARKQLKAAMAELDQDQNSEKSDRSSKKPEEHPERQEEKIEDDEVLFVKVPGSAYSASTETSLVSKDDDNNPPSNAETPTQNEASASDTN
ncbi:DNA annealing helicase and endonuclease ZRANB3 [Linum perenne]